MKFWQLQKLCLENAYTVTRRSNYYVWKKNGTETLKKCYTLIETAEEIKEDINIRLKERNLKGI